MIYNLFHQPASLFRILGGPVVVSRVIILTNLFPHQNMNMIFYAPVACLILITIDHAWIIISDNWNLLSIDCVLNWCFNPKHHFIRPVAEKRNIDLCWHVFQMQAMTSVTSTLTATVAQLTPTAVSGALNAVCPSTTTALLPWWDWTLIFTVRGCSGSKLYELEEMC